jgi:hypothetical protein
MAERKQDSRTSVGGGPRSQADAESQRSQDEGTLEQTGGKPMGRAPSGEPDVHLDVPSLHVGEISVDVERLEAHLALRAQLAGLVNLVAGAHVGVDKVRMEIKDVDAEAMLKVRLENTYNIFDRTLTTLDESPELMQYLHESADGAVEQMDDSDSQDTKAGGAVGELTSGAGDKLGDLPDTVGDTLSSAGGKASPKRMLREGSKRSGGEPEGSGREPEESSGEPKASSGGAIAKGAAAAGAAGAAGLAGAALLRKRPRRRILGIPIGRQNGIAALAKQIGDAGDQVAKAAKISKEIDKVRKTAQQALP